MATRNCRWDGPERKAGQVSSELAQGRLLCGLPHLQGGLIAGAPDKLLWEDSEAAARKIEFADRETANNYGVLEEIARRVIHGGRVISVRATDLPANALLAVILRHAV